MGAAVKTELGETRERAAELIKAGVDFLCVDSSKRYDRKCFQSLGYRDLASLHEVAFNGEVLMERMSEAGKLEEASMI